MMTATVRCHFSSFDGTYRVRSDLTIRDETREVEVEATVQGAAEDPWGTEREGVAIHVVLVAIQPVLRTRPVDRLNRRRAQRSRSAARGARLQAVRLRAGRPPTRRRSRRERGTCSSSPPHGLTSGEIGDQLLVSAGTVRTHLGTPSSGSATRRLPSPPRCGMA